MLCRFEAEIGAGDIFIRNSSFPDAGRFDKKLLLLRGNIFIVGGPFGFLRNTADNGNDLRVGCVKVRHYFDFSWTIVYRSRIVCADLISAPFRSTLQLASTNAMMISACMLLHPFRLLKAVSGPIVPGSTSSNSASRFFANPSMLIIMRIIFVSC